MSRITIDVTEEQHHKIKVLASLQKKTIKELVLENLFKETQKQYNKKTLKALDDAERDCNFDSFDSVDALFNKLGL